MRASDIDAIANAVMGTLAGSDPGLLGCGTVSSTQRFDVDVLECTPAYECGGAAIFLCEYRYDCGSGPGPFFCGESALADLFQCPRSFDCDAAGAFAQEP